MTDRATGGVRVVLLRVEEENRELKAEITSIRNTFMPVDEFRWDDGTMHVSFGSYAYTLRVDGEHLTGTVASPLGTQQIEGERQHRTLMYVGDEGIAFRTQRTGVLGVATDGLGTVTGSVRPPAPDLDHSCVLPALRLPRLLRSGVILAGLLLVVTFLTAPDLTAQNLQDVEKRVEELTDQLDAATQRFEDVRARVEETEHELAGLEARAAELEAQAETSERALAGRVREVFKRGGDPVLATFLSSDGVAGALERAQFLEVVNSRDHASLEQAIALRTQLSSSARPSAATCCSPSCRSSTSPSCTVTPGSRTRSPAPARRASR